MNTNSSPSALNISKIYRKPNIAHFPPQIEIAFIAEDGTRQLLQYEKMGWHTPQGMQSVRYGENPHQPAALYQLVNGNVTIAEVTQIAPGRGLVTASELLQSGKHPGKTNLMDIDVALQILRYFQHPTAVIMKHNNPCAVAAGTTIIEALQRARQADPIAAFGGTYVVNRDIDKDMAEFATQEYCEVVAAPRISSAALTLLQKRSNLRVFQIGAIEKLAEYIPTRYLDWRALMDGGLVLQWSYHSSLLEKSDFLTAHAQRQEHEIRSQYSATSSQLRDLLFGWHVVEALSSNAIVFVKDECTLGIGCGSLDRVGAVRTARDRAYLSLQERLAQQYHSNSWSALSTPDQQAIQEEVRRRHADLSSSVMASDAFFPFTDGVILALAEGIAAVAEPGGALRDWEIIECCNQYRVPLLFTAQRAFRH